MSPTAIIYARVSTLKQAEEELPIASQLQVAQRKAVALGATVIREFVDPGVSGRTDNRPEFKKAIAFCQSHQVNFLIIWDSARFSRDRIDAAAFKRAVRRAGTQLVYVSIDIDVSTDEGWMAESMIELFDEMLSRRVAKDTTRSMIKNAQDGFFNGGRVPYGYRAVPEGRRKRLAIDELEAPLVRHIFAAYVDQGIGFKEIAVSLNDRGFLKRGDPWNKKAVGLVLKNHRYIGISIFNRRDHKESVWRDQSKWIRAQSHEAIVDVEVFDRAQVMMAAKAPAQNVSSPRSRWAFTGLAHCGRCGAKMKISTGTGRTKKRYSYYSCSSQLEKGTCAGVSVNAEILDPWLVDQVIDRLLTPSQVAEVLAGLREKSGTWARERRQARELLVRELRDVEGKRDRLFKVVESIEPDDAASAGLIERLQDHKKRIRQIEASLDAIEAVPDLDVEEMPELDVQAAMGAVADAIRECRDAERLRTLFNDFIRRVEIRPDGVVALSYYPERMITLSPGEVVQSEGRWLPDLGSNQGPAD